MSAQTVLTLGIDQALSEALIKRDYAEADIIPMRDPESILDWMWEKGEQVRAIVVLERDILVEEMCSIIQQDWPDVRLIRQKA